MAGLTHGEPEAVWTAGDRVAMKHRHFAARVSKSPIGTLAYIAGWDRPIGEGAAGTVARVVVEQSPYGPLYEVVFDPDVPLRAPRKGFEREAGRNAVLTPGGCLTSI